MSLSPYVRASLPYRWDMYALLLARYAHSWAYVSCVRVVRTAEVPPAARVPTSGTTCGERVWKHALFMPGVCTHIYLDVYTSMAVTMKLLLYPVPTSGTICSPPYTEYFQTSLFAVGVSILMETLNIFSDSGPKTLVWTILNLAIIESEQSLSWHYANTRNRTLSISQILHLMSSKHQGLLAEG